MTFLVIII